MEQKYNRVKEALKKAIIAATSVLSIGFIVTQTMPDKLFGLFLQKCRYNQHTEVGIRGLRINLVMLPIIGFQIVSSTTFKPQESPNKLHY